MSYTIYTIYNFPLGHIYMKVSSTKEEWLKIALEFEEKWQFPNCIGTVDEKQMVIQPPDKDSHYYDNECLFADAGTNGQVADGGVWSKSSFFKSLERGSLGVPDCTLERGSLGVPDCKPLPFG